MRAMYRRGRTTGGRSTDDRSIDVSEQKRPPPVSKRRFVNLDLEMHARSRNELSTLCPSGHRQRVTSRRNGRNATRRDGRTISRARHPDRRTNFSSRPPRPCFSRTNKRRRCARAPNAPRHRARRRVRRKAARSGSTLTASITRARADAGKKATTRSSSRTPTIDRCTRSIAVIQTAMKRIKDFARATGTSAPRVSQRIARPCKKV